MSRLIDADALKERCKARECDPILKRFTAESWAKAYVAFREEIDEMPTIEAEPVRHGKWSRNLIGSLTIQDGFLKTCFKCSECNETNLVRSNFCPNCGAKMEVENG